MAGFDEHDKAFEAILARCEQALAGPQPAEMVHIRFAGQLSRLQQDTASKLQKRLDDASLKAKFDAEDAKLKELCGL